MRIALVGHHVAPIAPPFVGGVESQTWYLGRWLAARGHDVTVFAPAGSEIPGARMRELDLSRAAVSTRARLDVSSLPDPFLAAHHAYLQLMVELSRDCPFDVIHVNTLHYLPVAMAGLVPAPVTLTLHCPPTPWLESALLTAASAGPLPLTVTAVSESLAQVWSHAVVDPPIIGNGIDLDAWRPGPGGASCAWVGRIVPEKAPHVAIDAARRAGYAIDLAGPIIDQAYWAAEVEPRLGDDARYLGHLEHPAMVRLLGGARASIQSPAWDEPFGLTAAESMACGTPVATLDRGGLPDVIGLGGGAIAKDDGVEALAHAIGEAARLPRDVVRAEAELRLGIDAMGSKYEALYRRLTGRTDVPTPSFEPRASQPGVRLTPA
jgi:glycosyltransferase involved in cell wall biosynthesis